MQFRCVAILTSGPMAARGLLQIAELSVMPTGPYFSFSAHRINLFMHPQLLTFTKHQKPLGHFCLGPRVKEQASSNLV